MTGAHDQFRTTLEMRLREALDAPLGRRFADYFGSDVPYAGASFESYRPSGADSIDPSDLIALTFLSIGFSLKSKSGVTPHAALRLERRRDDIAGLLKELPVDVAIEKLDEAGFEELLGTGSHGDQLFELLRQEVGLPRVATYKLLARKRPALIPIRDTVVERALDQKPTDAWWRPWWFAMTTGSAIAELIDEIRWSGPSEAHNLSTLRTADIAIWMLRH